eukprot:163962_1
MEHPRQSLSNSYRKFFDAPLIQKASDPHELYHYLDAPHACSAFQAQLQEETLKTLTRERQFSHSGTIPPLRSSRPNRFATVAHINETSNLNVMVEPQTIQRLKENRNPKLNQIVHDDSIETTLKLGIGDKERQQIRTWLQNGDHKDWRADTLMNPKCRRLMHKLDVVRKKQDTLCKHNNTLQLKQEWVVPKAYPRGIIGVDTPILNQENDSIYYKQQIKKRITRDKAQTQILTQRRQRINDRTSVNSGLLYHCPEQFKHQLRERSLMQTKKAFAHPSFEHTNMRLFEGALAIKPCDQNES